MSEPKPIFEFVIETRVHSNVGGFSFVFGRIVGGAVSEGQRLIWEKKNGSRIEVVCKGIAGFHRRIKCAGGGTGEVNVGLLLGDVVMQMADRDRLICFEVALEPEEIVSGSFDFSIMGGVKGAEDDERST